MEASDYKQLKKRSNVLDFQVLANTRQQLIANEFFEIATEIQRILQFNAVEKPERHADRASLSTTYFAVDLDEDHVEVIIDLLNNLEAGAVGHNGETTSLASHYGSLVDAWLSLRAFQSVRLFPSDRTLVPKEVGQPNQTGV